jgi:hypothetical protein
LEQDREGNEMNGQFDNRRLAEILEPYGRIVSAVASVQGLHRLGDGSERVWGIALDDERLLTVSEKSLPPAVADLLALMEGGMAGDERRLRLQEVGEWLGGGDVSAERAVQLLQALGWKAAGTVIALLEAVKDVEDEVLGDAVRLLQELTGVEDGADGESPAPAPLIVRQGARRLLLLVPHLDGGTARETDEPRAELSAWLDTLGSELYLLCQAGVSSPLAEWSGAVLEQARTEAGFALEAGKLYQSKESVHHYERLGLARLLYGVPDHVRDSFLREVLPEPVLATLSPELRETIYAFLEHGQQVADTARSLYIHRNTLLYRLDRVTELTGLDVRKPLACWTLWLALRLSRSL